ncbi:MAG TPA: alpha/beta fold hydrolase [Kofleriaceae bacterium]|jgi:alpha-beta hydrolase superfamily lysophospholipase
MTYGRAAFPRDGLALALHSWLPADPHTVVFYVHGTQSHAGWLFETGPALAALGCAVYALDRRGSGESEGPRGHCESYLHWIEDYVAAMVHVRGLHRDLPMLLDGQSFGGAIAVAVAADPRACHDALLLVTPLIVQRAGLDLWKDVADDVPVRLPAPDEWFTRDPRYLEFLRDDTKMTRAITRKFHDARIALGEHYGSLALTKRPAALVLSRTDPMIKPEPVRELFDKLTGGVGMVIELPGTEHYLDFTSARDQLWRLVASFARTFA